MRRWLKREPNAVYRILHSAAKYHCELKLTGMSWGIEGGAVILTLRLATMSQVWETVYRQYLTTRPRPTRATKTPTGNQCYAKAA